MEKKEGAYLVSVSLLLSSGKSAKTAERNSIVICICVLAAHTLGPLNEQLNLIDLLVKSDRVIEAADDDNDDEAKLRK